MIEIKNKELKQVEGGFNLTAAFLTAANKIYNSIFSLGQYAGSAVRRIVYGNYCKL